MPPTSTTTDSAATDPEVTAAQASGTDAATRLVQDATGLTPYQLTERHQDSDGPAVHLAALIYSTCLDTLGIEEELARRLAVARDSLRHATAQLTDPAAPYTPGDITTDALRTDLLTTRRLAALTTLGRLLVTYQNAYHLRRGGLPTNTPADEETTTGPGGRRADLIAAMPPGLARMPGLEAGGPVAVFDGHSPATSTPLQALVDTDSGHVEINACDQPGGRALWHIRYSPATPDALIRAAIHHT